jgi:hypothetical protein
MKRILFFYLLVFSVYSVYAQNRADAKHFALKGDFSVSISGGGMQIIGVKELKIFPVMNPALGYHVTNRLSIVADAIFYTDGPQKSESSDTNFEFNKAIHYGLAARYYTKRNLKCGTATFQTGAYLFDTDTRKPVANWVFTPGWIYPLNKSEKIFLEANFDFQMNQIIKSQSFLMTAKLGVSYHF